VPVASQDRALWDAALVAEGLAVLAATAPGAPRGPFELEAAMAAVHGRAPTGAETDWHLLQELSADLLRLGDHPALRARHAWIAARATLAASVEGPPGRGILPG